MSVLEPIDPVLDDANAPSHFIVALGGPNGRSLAICERVMLVGPDQQDLPVSELASFVRKNALTAAPISLEALTGDSWPDSPASAWLRTATFAQSAEEDEPGEDEEESK